MSSDKNTLSEFDHPKYGPDHPLLHLPPFQPQASPSMKSEVSPTRHDEESKPSRSSENSQISSDSNNRSNTLTPLTQYYHIQHPQNLQYIHPELYNYPNRSLSVPNLMPSYGYVQYPFYGVAPPSSQAQHMYNYNFNGVMVPPPQFAMQQQQLQQQHMGEQFSRYGLKSFNPQISSVFEQTCYKCGNLGHFAEECEYEERLCYNCKQPGHETSSCPLPKSDELKQCYICRQIGHLQSNCPGRYSQQVTFNGNPFDPNSNIRFDPQQRQNQILMSQRTQILHSATQIIRRRQSRTASEPVIQRIPATRLEHQKEVGGNPLEEREEDPALDQDPLDNVG